MKLITTEKTFDTVQLVQDFIKRTETWFTEANETN